MKWGVQTNIRVDLHMYFIHITTSEINISIGLFQFKGIFQYFPKIQIQVASRDFLFCAFNITHTLSNNNNYFLGKPVS